MFLTIEEQRALNYIAQRAKRERFKLNFINSLRGNSLSLLNLQRRMEAATKDTINYGYAKQNYNNENDNENSRQIDRAIGKTIANI